MLPFGAKSLQEFVKIWNKKVPIDKWYRKKYNIPFGSEIHKNVNLADMFFEFYEFVFFILLTKSCLYAWNIIISA